MNEEYRPLDGDAFLSSEERRERIIEVLRQQDEVTVVELSHRLGVSEVTTRKDLQQLEEQGYLTRVRGGAVVSGAASWSCASPHASSSIWTTSGALRNAVLN